MSLISCRTWVKANIQRCRPTGTNSILATRTLHLCGVFFAQPQPGKCVEKNAMCYKRCIFWCISSRLNSHNSDINRIRCIAVVRTAVFGRFAATRRVEATHTRNILSSASWCLPCGFEDSGFFRLSSPQHHSLFLTCVLLLRCLKNPSELICLVELDHLSRLW